MAFGAKAVLIVRPSGSDTNAGGAFNAGNTNMATDLTATAANTSAPVVTSASYNFVAGDVGARVFIQSGTNWIPGWYTIASVASNAATLTASSANATLYDGTQASGVSTATGCATTGSPTGGVWSVDYSNKDAAQISYTDLVGVASTFTSVAFPVGKNIIGNYISVTAGTNYTVQRVEVVSTSTITATVDKTFGASATGAATAYLGGALASIGMAKSVMIASNNVFVKSGTYTYGTSTTNVSTGPVASSPSGTVSNPTVWEGFGTIPRDLGTAPVISAGSITSITMFGFASRHRVANIVFDGNSQSSVTGVSTNGSGGTVDSVTVKNTTVNGFAITGAGTFFKCQSTGCSGTSAFNVNSTLSSSFVGCEAYSNTTVGFLSTTGSGAGHSFEACLSYANSGASSDGFRIDTTQSCFVNCVAYNNGRHGFFPDSIGGMFVNCIAEAHAAGYGWSAAAASYLPRIINCGGYNNASGNIDTTNVLVPTTAFVTNTTGSFFTNAASGDFSLNNTVNQGALARGAGFPGVMPRGLSTGFADIGAIQHADPASAGVSGARIFTGF